MSSDRKLPVIELFGPTIQGEGLLLGCPTHFLRLGGCGYNCTWCDSMHAVDPAQVKKNRTMMSEQDIIDAVLRLPAMPWLTLTGGDPCLHKGLEDFVMQLNVSHGIKVAVETQGELWPQWLEQCDVVTFSPKGPSSGNITGPAKFVENLGSFRLMASSRVAIKIVVFTEDDLNYAYEVYNRANSNSRLIPMYEGFYFQVGSPLNSEIPEAILEHPDRSIAEIHKREMILSRYQWLTRSVLQRGNLRPNVYITPQMHTLLWPLEEKGR